MAKLDDYGVRWKSLGSNIGMCLLKAKGGMVQLDKEHLSVGLRPFGFQPGYRTAAMHSVSWVRGSSFEGVNEFIVCSAAGPQAEAVWAEVGIAVTKTAKYKRLGEMRVLKELAGVPDRGWSIIDSESAAVGWQNALITTAPGACGRLTVAEGRRLLEETQAVRALAGQYLSNLDLSAHPRELLESVISSMPTTMRATSTELYRSGGMGVPGTELAHELACAIIVQFSPLIPAAAHLPGQMNKRLGTELIDLISMIADHFISLPKE